MNFLLNLLAWLIILPWWGKLTLVGSLVLLVVGAGWWLKYQFHKIAEEGVLNAGAALADAKVDVHGIRPVPAPKGPSPYDCKPDDENFIEGLDDEDWDEPGVAFYELDATVTPADPDVEWNPTSLAPVPADWVGESKTDMCEKTGAVHTGHIYRGGGWVPLEDDENVAGRQRVKLLFGFQPDGVKAVQLRVVVTSVGEPFALPAPLPGVLAAR